MLPLARSTYGCLIYGLVADIPPSKGLLLAFVDADDASNSVAWWGITAKNSCKTNVFDL